MMRRRKAVWAGLSTAIIGLLVLTGCSETSSPIKDAPQFQIIGDAAACVNTDAEMGKFKVIKEGGSGTFYVVIEDAGFNFLSDKTISLDAGDCAVVHTNYGSYAQRTHVTVTETSAIPLATNCVAVYNGVLGACMEETATSAMNVVGIIKGAVVTFTNEPTDVGEGCTPGFWRNHLDDWPAGLQPGDSFNETFGVDWFDHDYTLGDAIWANGGGIGKLARHGTAALLNVIHFEVDYPITEADVIAAVQAGDADQLVMYNELLAPGFCE